MWCDSRRSSSCLFVGACKRSGCKWSVMTNGYNNLNLLLAAPLLRQMWDSGVTYTLADSQLPASGLRTAHAYQTRAQVSFWHWEQLDLSLKQAYNIKYVTNDNSSFRLAVGMAGLPWSESCYGIQAPRLAFASQKGTRPFLIMILSKSSSGQLISYGWIQHDLCGDTQLWQIDGLQRWDFPTDGRERDMQPMLHSPRPNHLYVKICTL